ncbi:MAG: hypothetical protein M4D80_30195 [Myxococcota bacterium]|nr:hypothetical protein [Deltaproteobacteria bacterium]MDQ3339458.1 hypothetical protein [Myxococcota bacterium]
MLSSRVWLVVLALAACDKKAEDKTPPPAVVKPSDLKRTDMSAPSQPPGAKPPESKPPEAKPAEWTERKGDGFSVLAPQDPKVSTKNTTATGTPLPTTMYTHYVPDGPGAVQVMFTELEPAVKVDSKKMFDAMRDSMLTQFSGKVTKQADITMGKAKGREYWLDGEHPQMGKLHVHVKFLLDAKRLYLVQSLYAADAADFSAQGDKFVDSFKLL